MIKYFTQAFKITNENIILATPMVLFLFLLSIYLGVAQRAPSNVFSAILLLVTILFMVSAFFAGWFYMVKKVIDLEKKEFIIDEDRARESFALLKEIPTGIGEYFLSLIGALILYAGLFILLSFVAFQLGMHFIGKVDINLNALRLALSSPLAMKALISSFSTDELVKLNHWNFLFLIEMSIYSFITMLWPAEIISRTKNPLLAFFRALKFTLKNFLSAFILFIYISTINFFVSMLNAISGINPLVYFIAMVLYFYFVVYVIVLIFLYYDRENCSKIKDNPNEVQCACTEGDSDCGSDSVGQEQSGDSDSEEE